MAKKRRMKKGPKIFLFLIIIIIVFGCAYLIYKNYNKDEDNKVYDTITSIINNQEKKKKEVKLTLVGDIMYEGAYLDAVNAGEDPNTYLSMVADKYFKKDDITIGNLETTITDNNKLKVNGYGYEFCTPQNIIKSLDTNSFELLGTTNNHTTDRGIDGINNTIDYLNNNTSITSVGTYKSMEDRKSLRIIEKNGVKVGFLAYALGMNDFGKYINENEMWRLGLYRKPPSYNQVSDELVNTMREEIRELKKNADVTVVLMHWGKEFQFQEREVDQIKLANILNEEHVDIVVGAHSHCMQPVKWYTSNDNYKTLVFYSMGNFTSADNTLDGRAGAENIKAYQVALLAVINIELDENNNIVYNKVKTEPIINYFDSNKRNFKMIPLSEYTSEYETSHILYNQGLNKTYINNLFNKQIDEQFR